MRFTQETPIMSSAKETPRPFGPPPLTGGRWFESRPPVKGGGPKGRGVSRAKRNINYFS